MKGLRYMNYINKILEKYELNLDELLILIVSFTVFLPFYFLVFSFNALFFYLLVSEKIIPVLKQTPYVKNVLAFSFFIKNELKEKKTCFLNVKKESIEKPIV